MTKLLTKYKSEFARCFKCGLCRSVCPIFDEIKVESAAPRGRVQLARAVESGELELTDIFKDKMLTCLGCMTCVENCPSGVKTDEIIYAARADLVDKGKLNFAKRLVFTGLLKNSHFVTFCAHFGSIFQRIFYHPNGFLQALVPRLIGLEDKTFPTFAQRSFISSSSEIIRTENGRTPVGKAGFFVGCATNYIYTDIGKATLKILSHHDIEVHITPEQGCCGIPVYTSGDFKSAHSLAERNKIALESLNVDYYLTSCSSCASALKKDCTNLFNAKMLSKPVFEITEFIMGKLKLKGDMNPLPVTVTYHDPCHLNRSQGISVEPRNMLKSIPGLKYIEMDEADQCCGGAGSFEFTYHNLSRKIGIKKGNSIKKTGVQYVATPCPSCRMQLEDILNHLKLGVKVVHPVELLAAAYGLNLNRFCKKTS